MKYVLLYITMHILMYSYGQVLPPEEDWEYLSNPYICQYGYVNNQEYVSVHCFTGVSGAHTRVYLQTKTGTLEHLVVPDELLEDGVSLTSSGPLFFVLSTSKGTQYIYDFKEACWKQKNPTVEKKMRGHDGTDPMD